VVADVQLTPTGAACNTVHTMFCASNQQNSYQEMLLLFGPPIPDQTSPSVVIVAPADGEVIDYEADFDLTVTLSDDRLPQVLATQVYFDELQAADTSLIDGTLTFPVNGGDAPGGHGLSNGPHTIRVDIADESGNPASASVTIEIVGNPAGDTAGDTGVDESGGSSGGGDSGASEGSEGSGGPPVAPGQGDTDEGCSCTAPTRPLGAGAGLVALLALGLRRRRGA
jgi:MYXO-CTERM domain-containing protein